MYNEYNVYIYIHMSVLRNRTLHIGFILERRLHSYISYISKACGKGLLGDASKRAGLIPHATCS